MADRRAARARLTVDEAASILGVSRDAPLADARAAFRRLLLVHHPDRTTSRDASDRTASIVAAYETMRARPERAVRERSIKPPARPQAAVSLTSVELADEPGTFVVALDSFLAFGGDGFFALLEASHQLGDVTYASRSDGIIETLVPDSDGHTCSLLLRLDDAGRAVALSADALDAGGHADAGDYARRLAVLLTSPA